MSIDTKKGIPGIPLSALDAISDDNTRQVLRAIVDGWHVRNGSSGDGKSRFVTAAELGDLSGIVGGVRNSVNQLAQSQDRPLSASEINRIMTDLQASVMESVLFKELGDRITLINQDFLDGLAAEAIARQAAITNESTIRQTAETSLASQVTTITAAVNTNAAAIQTETTARVNADNAITQSVTTQLATVNGNISALQTQQTTTANNVAALSSSVTTLQATVGTNTTAIQTEATARVNADNDIYSKYTVKIDTNGYVSGFGLISTANNSTPFSEFIVRADRFAIGSPSGPGITPKVPFVVLTTTDAEGNAPGVYIDSAIIKNAAIGTLKLDGEAVFVSRWATGNGGNTYSSTRVAIVTLNLPIAGLATGETAPMIVQGYSNYSPIDGSGASVYIDISVNDTIITPSFGVSVFGDATFSGNSAQVNLPNGTHVVKLLIKIDSPGVSSKYLNVNAVLIAMSGKR